MKVLVTGAHGFVGKNICPILSKNHAVFRMSSKNFNLLNKKQCEDALHVYKPDVVVHAAGTVGGIGANKDNPGKFIYENLLMGVNIIHASMEAKIHKFILLGTVCSYPKFTKVPFMEDDFWQGYPEETNAPYGIAKKTLGEMLMAYHNQYGMNGAYLIPCNMYGPYDHFNTTTSHVIPALITKFHEATIKGLKNVSIWGDGSPSREFLYAEDLADAINLAIEKVDKPLRFNIGTGIETPINKLVEMIADKMGYGGEILYDSSLPNGQPRRSLDTILAKMRIGFEAKTSLNEGLDKTIQWYKEQVNNEFSVLYTRTK
jgi:GDP-L-fucose synthase